MAIKFELFGLRETFNNVFEGDNEWTNILLNQFAIF